jgi:ABC-2 type transport system ATP-binding protein
MPETVISVRGLRKSYGDAEAVRGIDLEVERGEVFAFLGPNGAGKTTTVEILEGYRKRSAGEVSVLGEDPEHGDRRWRERIGIVLQSCRLDPYLTVRESLALYAGYYEAPRPIEETIELVGLGDKVDARASSLSGGQQRRLDVGMALIGDPELLFLDEPTTGFDPSARRQAWETIAGLRELGKTVFLTTHYMDEAQRLADRVTIISGGEIVAAGTPEDLGDRESRPARISYREDGREVTLETTTPVRTLNELTGKALAEGRELEGLEVARPSLEDVYLELTEQK